MVKQEVLAALDAVRGRYISGQELAAQLGVSRTAVWKAVAALRRDGIPIKAVTNRGYTLAQSVDVLNAAAVAVQLDEATVKALQIEVVDRLPGTNVALRSRADAGAREGNTFTASSLHSATREKPFFWFLWNWMRLWMFPTVFLLCTKESWSASWAPNRASPAAK